MVLRPNLMLKHAKTRLKIIKRWDLTWNCLGMFKWRLFQENLIKKQLEKNMMEDSNTWPLAHQVCTNQWWSVSNERHLLKIDTCGDMTRVKSFPATRDGIDGSQIAQNLWMIFCGQGSWDPALIMPQKGFMDLRINFGQLYQLLYSTSHKQKIPEKWEIYKYAKYGENIIELPSWKIL